MEKKFHIGAAYYPEVFDKDDVLLDIKRMKELNINIVRIGEFAWSTMEKEENKFDFSFFKYVLDKLYENDIDCVFCTPTPTPPKWLTDKYPSTLRVRDDSSKHLYGGRCHPCKSDEAFKKLSSRIIEEMMKNIGNHKAIISYQIDNEINPEDYCYCETCTNKFRDYLKEKYKTINNLNSLWGNSRWSLEYNDFMSIDPPNSKTWNHPSLQIEWERFHSSVIADFVDMSAKIIRKYSNKPISTDMMPIMRQNYYETTKSLDFVMLNHYEKEGDLFYSSFWFDFIRPIKNTPFYVTETQVNYNGSAGVACGYRSKGNCYINTMMPFIKGASVNMYWHFREHYAGQEIWHGAVYTAQGRLAFNALEIKKSYNDLEKIKDILFDSKLESDIAITYSTTSDLIFKFLKAIDNMWYTGMVSDYHKYLRHYNRDVIDTYSDFNRYKTIISPFLINATENNFKEKIIEFMKNGGTWIVGPMSDIMTDYGTKYLDSPHSFIEELTGCYLKDLIPFESEKVKAKDIETNEYLDIKFPFYGYDVDSETKIISKYENEWLDGEINIFSKKIGKGKIIVLGSIIDKDTLINLLDKKSILDASDNVELVERNNIKYVIEIENKNGHVNLDKKYVDLLTDKVYEKEINIEPFKIYALKEL